MTGLNEHREFVFTRADFARVRERIFRLAGISLNDSKFDLVYSRLARRLRVTGLANFERYLRFAESDPVEQREFVNALTTNLTAFFREPHHFEALARFLRERPAPIRIWCAAASTGEEPYSLAITAAEVFDTLVPPVRILATDLDTQVLAAAERGVYAMDKLDKISDSRRRRFFLRGVGNQAGFAKIRPELKTLLNFRQLNLLADRWPLTQPFDAIFLRNVLIYFDRPTQATVLRRCASVLKPDGRLFVGHSEALSHVTELFTPLGKTIYRLADRPLDSAAGRPFANQPAST